LYRGNATDYIYPDFYSCEDPPLTVAGFLFGRKVFVFLYWVAKAFLAASASVGGRKKYEDIWESAGEKAL
jgi:hypothetical protein